MRFQIPSQKLSRELAHVQGIADRRSTMPILSHVMLRASESGLELSATDLDLSVVTRLDCDVERPGAVALGAKNLYDIVRSLPSGGDLAFELKDNNWVTLRSGKIEYGIVGMSAAEFPKLPNPESVQSFEVPVQLILDFIERTLYCASTDDTRYNLNGVYFVSPKKGLLRAVATDGHRLAMSECEIHLEVPMKAGVILPRKGVGELKRILQGQDESNPVIAVAITESAAIFVRGQTRVSMRLVDGKFPDYELVIPKASPVLFDIHRGLFTDALRRISILSQDTSHGIHLELKKGLLRVSSKNPELGEGKEDITVDYDGDNVSVGFNARYILEALGSIGTDEVQVGLSDGLSPCKLMAKGRNDPLAVVMPMRI